MEFRFTEEEETLRKEVSEFLSKEIPPRWYELVCADAGLMGLMVPNDETQSIICEFNRKLARKGWFAPFFPKKYGGIDATPTEELVIIEELQRYRAPSIEMGSSMTSSIVGRNILALGTEKQKNKYCREIGVGEALCCLLYSEPEAGSDLGSLQTTAIESGDEFIVNGSKIFTTGGQHADYGFMIARTDTAVPKHKGLSMFIVDMKSPGITITPMVNVNNIPDFCQEFFDDVKVPKDNLLGEKNRGWYQLMGALSHERAMIGGPSMLKAILYNLIKCTKEMNYDGKSLFEDAVTQDELAKLAIQVEVCRVLAYRVSWMFSLKQVPIKEVSHLFLFCSRLYRTMSNVATEILGLYGQLNKGSKWAPMNGAAPFAYFASIGMGIGAGSQEIEMDIIGTHGLGLPR